MTEFEEIKATLARIEMRLDKIELTLSSDAPVAKTSPAQSAPAARGISAKEYVLQKNPSSDVQRTLVLGSFIELKGTESFTIDDLKQAFREARLKQPSNLNDKVNKNISKGYLMDAETKDNKRSWMLTASGQAIMDSGMVGEE